MKNLTPKIIKTRSTKSRLPGSRTNRRNKRTKSFLGESKRADLKANLNLNNRLKNEQRIVKKKKKKKKKNKKASEDTTTNEDPAERPAPKGEQQNSLVLANTRQSKRLRSRTANNRNQKKQKLSNSPNEGGSVTGNSANDVSFDDLFGSGDSDSDSASVTANSANKKSTENAVLGKNAKVASASVTGKSGAEMLLQLNKSQNEDSRHEDEYMSRVTKRGIKELLKFRRRAGVKRQAEDEKKDDEEFPQKRAKMSPSSMCHLTQVTEEPNDQCFQPPPKTSFKNSRKEKLKSPLTGLFFFGSGVDDHVRKSVYSMGGTFLDDVGRFTSKNKVKLKLFFLSSASKRRTHKYVLACALGVPMLHIDWLFALKKEFEEFKKDGDGLKVPGAFDNRRYIKYR